MTRSDKISIRGNSFALDSDAGDVVEQNVYLATVFECVLPAVRGIDSSAMLAIKPTHVLCSVLLHSFNILVQNVPASILLTFLKELFASARL